MSCIRSPKKLQIILGNHLSSLGSPVLLFYIRVSSIPFGVSTQVPMSHIAVPWLVAIVSDLYLNATLKYHSFALVSLKHYFSSLPAQGGPYLH